MVPGFTPVQMGDKGYRNIRRQSLGGRLQGFSLEAQGLGRNHQAVEIGAVTVRPCQIPDLGQGPTGAEGRGDHGKAGRSTVRGVKLGGVNIQ